MEVQTTIATIATITNAAIHGHRCHTLRFGSRLGERRTRGGMSPSVSAPGRLLTGATRAYFNLALRQVSRQLLLQSDPVVSAVVNDDQTKVAAVVEDSAFFNGSGIGGQPLGALNVPGMSTTSGVRR
jgi:hypothetical protein